MKDRAFVFQDELRYGTRTQLKRRWTPQKVRPAGNMKLGYEWGYLYAAIEPNTGQLYAYLLPNMSKASFQAFLKEFAQDVNGKRLLITDGAASHRSNLAIPPGIDLQLLPPYCPELNPVERFFQELRKALANRIYDDLQQVEQIIEEQLQQYWQKPYRIKQLTDWHWFHLDNLG